MDETNDIPELDEAMFAFSQADYQKAVDLLEGILKIYPDQFDALTAVKASN